VQQFCATGLLSVTFQEFCNIQKREKQKKNKKKQEYQAYNVDNELIHYIKLFFSGSRTTGG
jgi:hypothetical protein